MKKEELPQDKSALESMTRELMYVKDKEGKYTTDLSTGWEVKKAALDNAWDDIRERIEEARLAVKNGEKSPVYYFMELRIMDFPVLSGYTGFWAFTIRRHMKPSVFNSLSDKKLAEFRNRNIGFVFQFHHLLPEFTALENVCIPAFINGTSKAQAEARAKELLSFLGLSQRMDHKPSELSGGEQQRVAVARALINNPAVVLADEPSGNLDSNTAKELHALFFTLREKFYQTFVIVTHNEELANMADRKLVMRDGNIVD